MANGFKPGMEIKYASASAGVGKTIVFDSIIDIESEDFNPWRGDFRTHYAEYRNYDTGDTYWKKFKRIPKTADLYTAINVIRHNADGTYVYIKNRTDGDLRQLTEQEIIWLMLKV